MPNTGWISVTGEGSQNIDGGADHDVLWVEVHVTSITNPKIRITGSVFPRRLQYAGSLQLLTTDTFSDLTTGEVPAFDWPITWEAFEFAPPPLNYGPNSVKKMHWLLPPGITVEWNVFW